MEERIERIIPKPPFNFDLTMRSLTFFQPELVDIYSEERYRRVLEVNGKHFLAEVRSIGTIESPALEVVIKGRRIKGKDFQEVLAKIELILNVNYDLSPFYSLAEDDNILKQAKDALYGLRLTIRPSIFEALVIAITTQQINMPFAMKVKADLVKKYGYTFRVGKKTYYAFPNSKTLAKATIGELRRLKYSERKADYILELSKKVASGEIDLEALRNLPNGEVMERLLKLRGIGRWTVEWVLLLGMGRPDVAPADDLGIKRVISRYYHQGKEVSEEEVRTFCQRWGEYQGYAVRYLLMASRLGVNVKI